jgi:hypothetical protein
LVLKDLIWLTGNLFSVDKHEFTRGTKLFFLCSFEQMICWRNNLFGRFRLIQTILHTYLVMAALMAVLPLVLAADEVPPLPVLLEGKVDMVWWDIDGHTSSTRTVTAGSILAPTDKEAFDRWESTVLQNSRPEDVIVKLTIPAHHATLTLDPGTTLVISRDFNVLFFTDLGSGRGLEVDTSGADTLKITCPGDVLCEAYSLRDTHVRLIRGEVWWETCASVTEGIVRLSSPTSLDTHMLVGGQSLCLVGKKE